MPALTSKKDAEGTDLPSCAAFTGGYAHFLCQLRQKREIMLLSRAYRHGPSQGRPNDDEGREPERKGKGRGRWRRNEGEEKEKGPG